MARATESAAGTTGARPSRGSILALLVLAFVASAIAWRMVESEFATVERGIRESWRAEATAGAFVLGDAILRAEQSARENGPEAWLQRAGTFERPAAPRELCSLETVRGRDAEGDFLLAEAERVLGDPTTLPRAQELLIAARGEARDEGVRRVALLRLFGVQRRLGDEASATRIAGELLDRCSSAERSGIRELLMLRTEIEPGNGSLLTDLCAAIGGPDEGFARACLVSAGFADSAVVAARTGETARMSDLSRWAALQPDLAVGGSVARVRGGEVEVQAKIDASTRTFASSRFADDPRWTAAHSIVRNEEPPREWSERAVIGERLPGSAIERIGDHAQIVESARMRIGVVLLALVLVTGSVGFALRHAWRAAARERELAARQAAFVARVGHDLRTPLALIRMYAETIASGRVADVAQTREFAGIAVRESERLTRMVGNVLDFSRLSENGAGRSLERIEIRFLVIAIVDALRPLFEKAQMTVDVTGDDAFVLGDRDALSSLTSNLVENAIHHAASGGSLSVAIGRRGKQVRMAFEDRGPGMSPELAVRAFDRFVRGERATSRGTGLGLALVKEIAQAHGGDASLIARQGGGLMVVVDLPASEPESAA